MKLINRAVPSISLKTSPLNSNHTQTFASRHLLRYLNFGIIEIMDIHSEVAPHGFPEPSTRNELDTKMMTSNEALLEIQNGRMFYVQLDGLSFLNFHLIQTLRELKASGKPLIVSGTLDERVHSGLHTTQQFNELLAAFNTVDHVVSDELDLKRDQLALSSNVAFISNAISSTTADRIGRNNKHFEAPARDVVIESEKVLSIDDLPTTISEYQTDGKRVVVVTGVFDIVHFGHIDFLRKAASQGDKLIILTNSDASVRLQPKAHDGTRPIHPLVERARLLADLEFVDLVVPFDSQTAEDIFRDLHGITHVKAQKEALNESVIRELEIVKKNGGNVVLLDPISQIASEAPLSSTQLMQKYQEEIARGEKEGFFSGYSETTRSIFDSIIGDLQDWNYGEQQLDIWEARLRHRYELSPEEREKVELAVASEIFASIDAIENVIGKSREYHHFVIPLIIGRLVGLDIRALPRQRSDHGHNSEIINSVKLTSGKTAFYSYKDRAMYEPIEFEKKYWKPIPQHSNYMAYDKANPIGKRLYVFPIDKHRRAISIKILQEEIALATDPNSTTILSNELAVIARDLLSSFEATQDRDEQATFENERKRRKSTEPRVVAHGGKAMLKTAGSAQGFAENSRLGIEAGLANSDIDIVEIDVVPCADAWLVGHDIKLGIATTSDGLSTEKRLADFQEIFLRLEDGTASTESMPSLAEILELVKRYRQNTDSPYLAKIDIKYSEPGKEQLLLETLRRSGLPLEKILLTSGTSEFSKSVRDLAPEMRLELNTVEPTIFLLAYDLMDDQMAQAFIDFVVHHGVSQGADVVSMMYFAMNNWGDELTRKILQGIHKQGFDTMGWVIDTPAEYSQLALWDVTYAMMHDPKLITQTAEKRKRFHEVKGELEEVLKATRSLATGQDISTSISPFTLLPDKIKKAYSIDELQEFLGWL